MKTLQITRCAPLLATLLVCSGLSQAATFTVKPGGKYPTIAAGVAASGPNDKVLVKSGTYRENVVIPAGKNGLSLVASGKVTIQARKTGGAGGGPGIRIEAKRVTIDGFIVTNAGNGGSPMKVGRGIHSTALKTTVKNCVINGCSAGAIYISNHDARIASCKCIGNSGGVYVGGNNAEVSKVMVRNDLVGTIEVEGHDARVTGCDIRQSGNEGVVIDGDRAVVTENVVCGVKYCGLRSYGIDNEFRDNLVEHSDGDGISHGQQGGVISGNTIRYVAGRGITCTSSDVTIRKNVLEYMSDSGIEATGYDLVVAKNEVRHCRKGGHGIFVAGSTNGAVVTDNMVTDCQGSGIQFDSSGSSSAMIENNVVRDCNQSGVGAGLLIRGQRHKIRDNKIEDCAGDGIYVEGLEVQIASNVVKRCCRDGIDIDSSADCRVKKNAVSGCGAEGIENNGANTVVEKNTMKGNRTDLANSGTGSESGNTYATGGWSTAPEID